MDFLNIIATLRKFGNFLAGLFPILGVIGNRVFEFLKLPQFNDFVAKLRTKPPFSAIAPIVDRFFWKDYAKDRLEIAKLAPEMVPILKMVALISVSIVFLLPLSTVFHNDLVKITLGNGTITSAPSWTVWCWIIISAFAWACLTTGAAISNRLALVLVSLGCIYTLGTCALFLPRSYWNASLSVSILLGIMISAKVLPIKTLTDKIAAIVSSIVSGAPTGLVLTALTPLHHYAKPFVLQWGAATGSILGVLSLGTAREKKSDTQPLRLFILTITISSMVFLTSLVVRGGLSAVGDQLLSSIKLCNGYLWPIWYYIGVGIIYKLLKNARIITRAVQDLMPKVTFVPLALIALAAGLAIFWSPVLAMAFFPPHPLAPISAVFIPIYQYYRSVLNDPTNIYTSEWMRWIFCIDLFVVLWMIAKSKLSRENMGTLAYFTLLSWFFIAEYTFQVTSFSHAPRQSEVMVTLFAIWLLWLFHTSILEICSNSSRLWPAQGRQLLYSGFVCLCLLELSARTIVHDYNVSNEIFLMMFRGIIDVGIPYFMFVFATRKLNRLPISTLRLFQSFCLGALFTLPMNVLDKFALSGGTISAFTALWKAEVELYSTVGIFATTIPHLPAEWLFLRAILYVCALVFLTAAVQYVRTLQWLRNREPVDAEATPKATPKATPGAYSTLVFCLISFAGGFASFSKTAVDLPLPTDWKVLISPFSLNIHLDYYWLVAYLSSWLSALMFLLLVPQRAHGLTRGLQFSAAISVSVLTNFAIQWLYPGQEYELLSANLLPMVSITGVCLFLYLGLTVWNRVQKDLAQCNTNLDNAATSQSHPLALDEGEEEVTGVATATDTGKRNEKGTPLFTGLEVTVVAAITFLIFGANIFNGLNSSRLISHRRLADQKTIKIPAHWIPNQSTASAKDLTNHFYALGDADLKSFMDVGALPANSMTLQQTFESLAEKLSQTQVLKNFSLKKVENWSDSHMEVVTGYFTYSQMFSGSEMTMTGITSLMREKKSDQIQFVTIYCFPSELQRRLADLRRIVDNHTHG